MNNILFMNQNNNIYTKERVRYIDISKGILILLLIIHHLGAATSKIGMQSRYDYIISCWQPIFTVFFMPCFFLISGYCSNFSRGYKDFICKIIRQLIIPYVVFTIILNLSICVEKNNFGVDTFVKPITTVPNTSLWFILSLIFSKIILYIMICCKFKNVAIICISIFLLFLGVLLNQFDITPNYFTYHNCLISVFFVVMGWYLKNNISRYQKFLKYCQYLYPVLFILSLGLFKYILHIHIPRYAAGIDVDILSIPIFILLSISGSLFLINISKKIDKNAILEYFGKNSLIIYALHFITLKLLAKSLLCSDSLALFIGSLIIIYIIEIVICVLLIEIFNKTALKCLIGK